MFFTCTADHTEELDDSYSRICSKQLNNFIHHFYNDFIYPSSRCECEDPDCTEECDNITEKLLRFCYEEAFINGNVPVIVVPIATEKLTRLLNVIQHDCDVIIEEEVAKWIHSGKVKRMNKRDLDKVRITFVTEIDWAVVNTLTQVLLIPTDADMKKYIKTSFFYAGLIGSELLSNVAVFYGKREDFENDIFMNALRHVHDEKEKTRKTRNKKKNERKKKAKDTIPLDLLERLTLLDSNGVNDVD